MIMARFQAAKIRNKGLKQSISEILSAIFSLLLPKSEILSLKLGLLACFWPWQRI